MNLTAISLEQETDYQRLYQEVGYIEDEGEGEGEEGEEGQEGEDPGEEGLNQRGFKGNEEGFSQGELEGSQNEEVSAMEGSAAGNEESFQVNQLALQ
jgi:hypothetical protein